MDNFVDRLVEKLNSQGRVKREASADGSVRETGSGSGDWDRHYSMLVEQFAQYMNENQRARLEAVESILASQTTMKQELKDEILAVLSDKTGSDSEYGAEPALDSEALMNSERRILASMDSFEDRIENNLGLLKCDIADSVKSSVDASLAGISASNDSLVSEIRSTNAAAADELKRTGDDLVDLVRRSMDDITASVKDSSTGVPDSLKDMKEELTDHVHKECVKTYRNVQAAIEETMAKNTEAVISGVAKGSSVGTKLMVGALAFAGIDFLGIVIIILWILKII